MTRGPLAEALRHAAAAAERLAGEAEGNGWIVPVRDPPFRGARFMEVEATAFLARALRDLADAGLLGSWARRAAGRLAWAALAEAGSDGSWGLWSYAAVTASQLLSYALRAGDRRLAAELTRTVRGLGATVHVPNQEAFNTLAQAAHARLTGDPRSRRAALLKARALHRLLSLHGPNEPWGVTTAYHAALLWALADAHRALGLPGALEASRGLHEPLEGLVDPYGGVLVMLGRSAYFSFAHATVAAVLLRHHRATGDPRPLAAALHALHHFNRLYADPEGIRKNPHGSTVIREYGPRELYEAWAAAVIADAALHTPLEAAGAPTPGGPRCTSSPWHTACYAPGHAATLSALGYDGFDNYQPPCALAYARTPGGVAVLTPLTGSAWRDALAPLRGPGGEPLHPTAYAARAGRGWCVLAALLPGGRLWVRRASLAPGRVVIVDDIIPPTRGYTVIYTLEGSGEPRGRALRLPGGAKAYSPAGPPERLAAAPAQPGRLEAHGFPLRNGRGVVVVSLAPGAAGPRVAAPPATAVAEALRALRGRVAYRLYARGALTG